MATKYAAGVQEFLATCEEPQGVESIRKGVKIGNWVVAQSTCLELVIEGKIQGLRTGWGWVFWVEKKGT